MRTATLDVEPAGGRSRSALAVLVLAALIAVAFVVMAAAPYYTLHEARFGPYWTRRVPLLLHISSGVIAILTGLATAWVVTTGMAFLAIKRALYGQHKEWMIRSYVVTFAFVFFRAMTLVGNALGISPEEGIVFASWACWSVPLLMTEAIVQGRKILAVSPS